MYTLCVSAVGMLPVHAAQSQVNIWILKQHPRKEVLFFRMDQVRRIYDLQVYKNTHTHKCLFATAEQQCCSPCNTMLLI